MSKAFGRITDKRNKPLANLTVCVYDRDMRSEELLGESVTDKKGKYEITWKSSRPDDITVKVFTKTKKNLLFSSGLDIVRFNASDREEINIIIEKDIKPEAADYDSVLEEINAVVRRVPLTELQENEQHRDITFLSRKTGLPAENIERLVIAHRLQAASKIDADFFYALLRKDTFLKSSASGSFLVRFNADVNAEILPLLYDFALVDWKTVKQDVDTAVKEMIVSSNAKKECKNNYTKLQKYKDKASVYYQNERPQKIIGLISNFVLEDKISAVEKLFTENKDDLSAFLKSMSDNKVYPDAEATGVSEISVMLGELFGFEKTIISEVKESLKIKEKEDIRKLAYLNKEGWQDVLTKTADKINLAGKPLNKKVISIQASSLARKMEKLYPTAAFSAQLGREKKSLYKNQKAIADFLTEHEDFDLQSHNLDLFLKEKQLTSETDSSMREELKTMQRVFKLVPHYGKTNALLENNVRSAYRITALGKTRFLKEVAPKAGIKEKEAKAIYRKAEQTTVASMLIAGNMQDMMRAMDVPALQKKKLPQKLEAVSQDFPNLKSLFKLKDCFACEHGRSVLSPAAYLVEILEFLDNRIVTDLTTTPKNRNRLAKEILFERRPDLGDIDLGVENAETPVPYIDLVCEQLEEAIIPDTGITYSGVLSDGPIPDAGTVSADLLAACKAADIPLTENAQLFDTEISDPPPAVLPPIVKYLRDDKAVCKLTDLGGGSWRVKRLRQTYSTAGELDAAPEYVNGQVYQELAGAKFAFQLPFDLNHVEAKAYFSRFNISRAELMSAFQVSGSPADSGIAAEILGLTDEERDLITNPRPQISNQELYWNTPSHWDTDPVVYGGILEYMKRLDHFLDKTGLTYNELVLLLCLNFIDPEQKLFILHNYDDSSAANPVLSSDLTKKEIANLDIAALDRIHRFLRLQKKTGLKLEVLDQIICQHSTDQNHLGDCLIRMAALTQITEETGIKQDELAGFYSELPHRFFDFDNAPKPLYYQVFLNKAKTGFIDERLLPEITDSGSELLENCLTSIAVCLQISEKDLTVLCKILPDGHVTFANLSYLFAASRLMGKLKIKAEDFIILVQLTGINIQEAPQKTLDFVKAVRIFQASPIKAADLQFMLRHDASNLLDREIKDEKIQIVLEKLQKEFQRAFSGNKSPFNPDLSADDQKESLQALLSQLPKYSEDYPENPGLSEADVQNMMGFIDRQWEPASAAKLMITGKLGPFLDAGFIGSILTCIDSLEAASDAVLETERNALLQAFMEALTAYRYAADKKTILSEQLAATFKADTECINTLLKYGKLKQAAPGNDLLSEVLSSDAIIDTDNTHSIPVLPSLDAAAFPKQFQSLRLLHKLLPLVNALELENDELEWYLNHNADLGWIELDAIPCQTGQAPIDYQKYADFTQFLSLAQTLTPVPNPADAENPVTFFNVLELLLPGSTVTKEEYLEKFALLIGYDKENVTAAAKHLCPVFSLEYYRHVQNWTAITKCLEYLRKLGCVMEQVAALIDPVLSAEETKQLRTSLKSRYDEDTWLSTLKEIMDSIRPQKRNALIAYLLAVNPEFKDTNDLYDHFLIDVEMEAGMPSSRIVQSHGAVQLFVQRCLMGLEPKAAANVEDDPGWEQWKWMKNYRVWEANRKVFLYPENWIEAELRDDKSFLFTEMENELQQNELTDYNAEQALIRYLEKLDNISFLEVVAAWYQVDIKTMHVFARTKGGDPALYYYRRFEQERYWTPWEKVELDITGNHLLAFMRNHRLCLAWPMFSEEPEPQPKYTLPNQSTTDPQPVDKPKRKLKVQLAISEFANQKWQPKKISADAIMTPQDYYTSEDIPRENFKLFYNEFAQQIVIYNTIKSEEFDNEVLAGAFNLTGCKGYPELADFIPAATPLTFDFLPKFPDTKLINQRYIETENVENDLAVLGEHSILAGKQIDELLLQTPGIFRLTYPHQLTIIDILAFTWPFLINYANMEKNTASVQAILRYARIPLGTLLPYYMEDSNHSYVIVPGFYEKTAQVNKPDGLIGENISISGSGETEYQNIKRTVSDVLQLFEDIAAFIQSYKKYKANSSPTEEQKAEIIDDALEIVHEFQIYAGLKYGEGFRNMHHPLVCPLRVALYKDGIPALMKRETQLYINPDFNFKNYYQPTALVPKTYGIKTLDKEIIFYPVEDIDFTVDGSYSCYNWELFFHLPFLIATRLTQNQRYEEALTWFHFMFNPTGALDGPAPQKFWITKPFYLTHDEEYEDQLIDNLMYKVADAGTPEIKELEAAIEQWRNKPFKPHVVARFRPVAYQKALLMKYIDNLTEWGDYLFRQDTMESIAQATQMYILADKLLGPKPRVVPPVIKQPYETYNQIKSKIDSFGNALIELENILPGLSSLPEGGEELPPAPITLSMLYFCIPPNDKIQEYWDRIADRLFKIRHCQNIDGVERSLALFAPPIDPGMLVRAAAAGLDISAVIAGMNAPAPYYRFNVLSQKATELTQEVRTLGNALLQTMEKKDAEALSLLRSALEIKLLLMVKDMKQLAIEEAGEQIEILNRTKAVTEEREKYYSSIQKIISKEQLNLDKLSEAQDYQQASQIIRTVAGALALIPDMHLGANGFGGTPEVVFQTGGSSFSRAAGIGADVLSILSSAASYEANRASTLAGFERRYDDWKLQERLSKKELAQIEKQIAAAEIRKEMAETDLRNHELQIENAKKTDEFMRSKFTNMELYNWMIGQITSVYFRSYQLAHDFAKKAEKSYQFELGRDDTFIQYGYWDSMKKGLQTADHLLCDIKRMETSYLDKNKREYELTKHVSLAMLDPLALIKLKSAGVCDFDLPEAMFDMDYPGQYFRRLKSVSVSLPCVTGPYTSVSAKLSLVSNKYRKNTNTDNAAETGYGEDPGNDERFAYNLGAIQSIAASNSQNDSGVFELNFRDERYLPFEGAGAVSSWRLELPQEIRQFDYNTIADVILHVKYTAREGGSTLRGLAETALKDRLAEIKQRLSQEGLHVAINLKHDCPNEWHLLKKNGTVDLKIDKFRLPYMAQTLDAAIEDVIFMARAKSEPAEFSININENDVNLSLISDFLLYKGNSSSIALDTMFTLSISNAEQLTNLDELMLIVKYSF